MSKVTSALDAMDTSTSFLRRWAFGTIVRSGTMAVPHNHEPILATLARGQIIAEGQFLWGSNYSFLVRVRGESGEVTAVYKPARGEQPLWDFPAGTLGAREAAAYLTSQALGWGLVPPTVLRQDGPAGPGSLQLFVDADPERHYFTFTKEEKARLRPVVAFDVLINNADRKGGHVLLAPDGHLWLIDHGVCFHEHNKLRTVIWDFAGQPISVGILKGVESFRSRLANEDRLREAYARLLSAAEIAALERRAERLLREGRFPLPGPTRPYPWPLV
ncbi:MAG: SCO1664 family protein [Chloroflexota bacterium]